MSAPVMGFGVAVGSTVAVGIAASVAAMAVWICCSEGEHETIKQATKIEQLIFFRLVLIPLPSKHKRLNPLPGATIQTPQNTGAHNLSILLVQPTEEPPKLNVLFFAIPLLFHVSPLL